MINFQNKNHSLLAKSKNRNNKKHQMNSTLNKLFSPNSHSHFHTNSQNPHNLTYISPDLQQSSLFKSKLYNYLHPHHPNTPLKSKRMESAPSMTSQQLKSLKKSVENEKIEKRKSMREYMCHLSLEKRKNFENKTVQLGAAAIKQQKSKSNPLLIIRKIKQLNEQRSRNTKSPSALTQPGPIHNAHLYYYSHSRSRTEPIQFKYHLTNYDTQQRHVSISRICELRQHLAHQQKETTTQKDLMLINEIHPTIAIITTRQFESKHQEKERESPNVQRATPKANPPHAKRRQEDQISPWEKKNHENQLYEGERQ